MCSRESQLALSMAMASSLTNTRTFLCQFPSKPSILPKTPSFLNPCISTSPSTKSVSLLKQNCPRASPEELPAELIEDSKFVPLDSEEPSYGPPALLLLGFEVEEAAKIQLLLKEMGGEFLEIIFCTEDMINRSLWDAVNAKQPNLDTVKIAKSLPRICFLSGLTGEEMMMFIDAFPESGLKPPAFAALVPNSADKTLEELIEEVMGDHEMLNRGSSWKPSKAYGDLHQWLKQVSE